MLIILFCVAKEMFWRFFPLSFRDLLGDIMASKRDLRSYFVKTDDTNKETSSNSQKVFMASKRDLWSYFVKTDNTNKETSSNSQNVFLIIQSSSNITGEKEIQYVQQVIKKQVAKPAKHYHNIP